MYDRHPTSDARSKQLIDRIRQEIQERLEQVLAEAEKLRAALAALDPRERPKPQSSRARSTGGRKPARDGEKHGERQCRRALGACSCTRGDEGKLSLLVRVR